MAQKNVDVMVPLQHLSNFWRTLQRLLINCEINQTTTCLANCFIIADPVDSEVATFAITDTKLYVPVVTLSTEDNAKLLQQFKSSYKSTINWNKYQSKVSIEK